MSGTLNTFYNNVNYALHLNGEALIRLQEQSSTGSRINRVSDDPSTAHRVLELNSQKSTLENYTDNLLEVSSMLELSASTIGDIASVLSEARTRLTQIASGIYSDESRSTAAEGINDLLEQVVSLANTQQAREYLFGGGHSSTAPYTVERTDGEITRVTYQGNTENRNVEVAPGVNSSAFFVGQDIFHSDDRGEPIFLGDTGAKAGAGTSNVRGNIWLTVTGSAGDYILSIDDGLSTFHTDGTDTNLAVTDSSTGKVLYVDTTQISDAGIALVQVPGTCDIFNALITIRDILRNENELPDDQFQEAVDSVFTSLNELSERLVQAQVSAGTKIGFLDDVKDSLENLTYHTEDETTRLQEADIAQIAIDLSRREILYEMSLSVAGKLLSLSLLDFI
jgi:flagellar hook-associated protein 3 FlgL